MDFSHADCYRADLSGASLKGAHATQAVFYQARLQNTVLTAADLSKANFSMPCTRRPVAQCRRKPI